MHHAIYILIPAAGQGRRMGQPVNKLFITLDGRTLIQHLSDRLAAFAVSLAHDPIHVNDQTYHTLVPVWITRSDEVDPFREVLPTEPAPHFVTGGATRQASVYAGLSYLAVLDVPPHSPVLIHDAARCLVPPEILRTTSTYAAHGQACAPALPASDTVRTIHREATDAKPPAYAHTLNRDEIVLMQTPQAAPFAQLYDAHRTAATQHWDATDDVDLLMRHGHTVVQLPGAAINLKITHPDDTTIATAFLQTP